MARKPKKPTGRLLRKDIRRPEDTGHSQANIAAILVQAEEPPKEKLKVVRSLPRESLVIAEKVFQWRLLKEDVGARDDHILELANIIASTGTPLDAILVFRAGDKFYVVDGHHRLAAYDTARWTKPIPVKVSEGTLNDATDAALKFNSKNTRNLSQREKQEAAWTLGKRQPVPTREVICEMTSVSSGTIDGMRKILKKLREAGESEESIADMTLGQARGKQWPTEEGRPKWDPETWMAEKADKLVAKMETAGIGFMLRQDHEITAMALERIDARLTKALVTLWAFRPENKEALEELMEEFDSVEPQKF